MPTKYAEMDTVYADPTGLTADIGDVIQLDGAVVDDLVAGGFATEVATPDGLPAPATVVTYAVNAIITVGAEAGDARAITIQLLDADGRDLVVREAVQIAVLLDASGDAFVVTGGSTGIAIGTDGALLAIVAKKLFLAISEADGGIDLTWTDTGTEAAYLAVILSNGKMIISSDLTNA